MLKILRVLNLPHVLFFVDNINSKKTDNEKVDSE